MSTFYNLSSLRSKLGFEVLLIARVILDQTIESHSNRMRDPTEDLPNKITTDQFCLITGLLCLPLCLSAYLSVCFLPNITACTALRIYVLEPTIPPVFLCLCLHVWSLDCLHFLLATVLLLCKPVCLFTYPGISVCLTDPACLSPCLLVWDFDCIVVCLSACLSICWSAFYSVCLSVAMFASIPVNLFVSVYLYACMSICLATDGHTLKCLPLSVLVCMS